MIGIDLAPKGLKMPTNEAKILELDESADFMNDPGAWVMHELRLLQMQGLEGEAVVYHCETRQNAADAVRSARPRGVKDADK